MSGDEDDIYFSHGISEELLNLLARIPDLKVSSRTSSFHFAGTDVPLKTIAAQLGVRHILEGSVRRSNNRVRITAQLIDAKTDAHLWSETYDHKWVSECALINCADSSLNGPWSCLMAAAYSPVLLGHSLTTNANTVAGFYDTLGRYLFANVTLRW